MNDEIPTDDADDRGPILGPGSRVTYADGRFREGIVFAPTPLVERPPLRFYLDGEEVSAAAYFDSIVTYVVKVRRGTGEVVSLETIELLGK